MLPFLLRKTEVQQHTTITTAGNDDTKLNEVSNFNTMKTAAANKEVENMSYDELNVYTEGEFNPLRLIDTLYNMNMEEEDDEILLIQSAGRLWYKISKNQ